LAAIQVLFAQVDLSEGDALDLADLLFKERTFAARRAGFKSRQQARRDQRGELSERVELSSDRAGGPAGGARTYWEPNARITCSLSAPQPQDDPGDNQGGTEDQPPKREGS
jgi:hypothetical protein